VLPCLPHSTRTAHDPRMVAPTPRAYAVLAWRAADALLMWAAMGPRMSAAADHTDQPDRARLRVAAQAAQNKRAALFNAETILALLDTLDRAERERDDARVAARELRDALDRRDADLRIRESHITKALAFIDSVGTFNDADVTELRALLDRTADNHDTKEQP
jgi:hypothetical protein